MKDFLGFLFIATLVIGGGFLCVLFLVWAMHFVDWYDLWLTNYFDLDAMKESGNG